MEPRRGPAQALTQGPPSSTVFRLRLLAACALLVGLAFVQAPGLLTADTKLDLATAPAELLGRALHLWDGAGAFGQVQNQAYGYLWPMGPFFLGGWLLAIPGWVVQRLWLGLVLSVALTGSARLARALGIRSDLACLLAGFAYALSPRMLTTLGPISIEAWPSALAPWVLLPLVVGAQRGDPRRYAALSALGVAMVGGVNAAATFAVVPLGALWLLTREPGPRRRTLLTWWPLLTALGTLWWLVPLFLLGAYSPPFLDFIETTTVTTFPTTPFDVLRGTSDWVPYLDPTSRAGNDLLTTPYLVLNSGVVLLLGCAGLIDRRTPHRRFLALGLLVGVLMVGAGHGGSTSGWFAAPVRELLDGALAPLRNVHKFDPILRIPLVLGLGFVVDRAVAAARRSRDGRAAGAERGAALFAERVNRWVLVALAVVAVAGAAVPVLLGRIPPAGAFQATPDYWSQAAAWLGARDGDGLDGDALLVPGSSFGSYVWGAPHDEPMQWLASSPWAVRNVIPLAPGGNIRMLTAIEDRLAQGEGSAGLTTFLQRAGVRYLVVRNDLAVDDDVPVPVLVHQAIQESPGLVRVAAFGPSVGGQGHLRFDSGRVLVDGGWQSSNPAIEIYAVPGASSAVSAGDPPVVVGGPEDLLDLADAGVVGGEPARLATDVASEGAVPGPGGLVLTDGLRDRERSFARIHDGWSATGSLGDVRRTSNRVADYPPGTDTRWLTTARLEGVSGVSASSSASDAGELGGSRRGELPSAALDGSAASAWVSGAAHTGPAWWRVDLSGERRLTTLRVVAPTSAAARQQVVVRTRAGTSDPAQLTPGQATTVRLGDAAGSSSWVQVEAVASGSVLSLAEVWIPGLHARRALVLPVLPRSWGDPDTVVLRRGRDVRTGCVVVGRDVRCVPGRAVASEEPLGMDRVVTLSQPKTYPVAITVSPRPGRSLDRLLLGDQPADVVASSTGVPDPRASALAAIDGDPGTTWSADRSDLRSALDVSWLGTRAVRGLRLWSDPDAAARLPTRLTLVWPGGHRRVAVHDGRVRFPTIRTDRLRLEVDDAAPARSITFAGQQEDVPVGIGELRVVGVPYLPLRLSTDRRTYPCGSGPDLTVDGERFRTAVAASPADLLASRPATATVCASAAGEGRSLPLRAGENVVTARASAAFEPDLLVLGNRSAATAVPVTDAARSRGAVTRLLEPSAGASVVVLHENENAGWHAEQDGSALTPFVADGWQQGFVLHDDRAPVRVSFTPDRLYRAGLLLGLLAGLALVAAVVVLGRRRASGPPQVDEWPLPAALVLGVSWLGCALVGGTAGLLIALLASALSVVLDRRFPRQAPWVLAAPCFVAAAAYALRPWGDSGGWAGQLSWVQLLVLVPLAAVLASAAGPVRMSLRRRAGRSIRR